MNCHEFARDLKDAIESHGPTANEVAAYAHHAENCDTAQCKLLWEETELLLCATSAWQADVPIVDLTDRVVAELRSSWSASPQPSFPPLQASYGVARELKTTDQPTARKSSPFPSKWITLASLVAAVLLLVPLLTLSQPGGTELANSSPVVPQDAEASPVDNRRIEEEAIVVADRAPRRRLEATYAVMPLSATEFVTDAVVLVVPGDLSDSEDETSRPRIWADRLARQWEPIGRGLSSAFDALMEAVPKSSSAS